MKWFNLKNEKGASMVEFALILPVLLLILLGIIEFGLLMFNRQVLTNASREGARAGIVAQSPRLPCNGDPSITQIVSDYCDGYLITFGTPQFNVACTQTGMSFGDNLTVTATYLYRFLVLGNMGFSPVNLNASTTMKYE